MPLLPASFGSWRQCPPSSLAVELAFARRGIPRILLEPSPCLASRSPSHLIDFRGHRDRPTRNKFAQIRSTNQVQPKCREASFLCTFGACCMICWMSSKMSSNASSMAYPMPVLPSLEHMLFDSKGPCPSFSEFPQRWPAHGFICTHNRQCSVWGNLQLLLSF
jgi:hypothetical protein